MAITRVLDGVAKQVYCFSKNGYMYTIGQKNGVGKLYQPGTRGLVVDDCASTAADGWRPTLIIKPNQQAGTISRGYAAKWSDDGRTIHHQSSGCPDTWGLDSLILYDGAHSTNFYWYFPRTITLFNYGLDYSRYGDKPVIDNYELVHGGTNNYRCLNIPNATIYKWEAHVVLTWRLNAMAGGDIESLEVYIPYYNNSTTANFVKLDKIQFNNVTGATWKFSYFAKEMSSNLYNGAILNFPVIHTSYKPSDNFDMEVQTKFCFKAN